MTVIEYKHGESHSPLEASCAALGFFDGVHLGHRAVLSDMLHGASEVGLLPLVFTFPSEGGIKPGARRLFSTEEKLRVLRELGVEVVVLCDFASVAQLTPEEFVRDVLVGAFGVRFAFAGRDFRFGHRAEGDSEALVRLMRASGGDAVIHEMRSVLLPDGSSELASATRIREYLASGRPEFAAALIGEPYSVYSTVVRGDGRGHSLGYPTVNTDLAPDTPLRHGVYRTRVRIEDRDYVGLTNVGRCPTFGERAVHAETFIIGFSGDVYGSDVSIAFLEYLREERSFASAEELGAEIKRNIEAVAGGGHGTEK